MLFLANGYNPYSPHYRNICLPLALAAFYPDVHYLHFVYGLGYHLVPTDKEHNIFHWRKIANFLYMNYWGVINVSKSFSSAFPFMPNKKFRQCAVSTFVKTFNRGIIVIKSKKTFEQGSHAIAFADGYVYDAQWSNCWIPVAKYPKKLKRVVFSYYPLESMT